MRGCVFTAVLLGCLFQKLGRPRHAPCADSTRRTLERMSGCGGQWRGSIDDAIEHDGRLPQEQLEDFPSQPAIAERHAIKMGLIKGADLAVVPNHGHQTRRSHGPLPPNLHCRVRSVFHTRRQHHKWLTKKGSETPSFIPTVSKLLPGAGPRHASRPALGPTAAALLAQQ